MKFLTSTVLAIVFLTALTSPSNASIVAYVSDDGTDMTIRFFGTFDLTGTSTQFVGNDNQDRIFRSPQGQINVFFTAGTNYQRANGVGTLAPGFLGTFPGISQTRTGTGDSFGYTGTSIFWDERHGSNPGVIDVDSSFLVAGRTVSAQFGTGIDTQKLLWTHNTTGDTISIVHGLAPTATPEATSFLMFGSLGGLLARRRRR